MALDPKRKRIVLFGGTAPQTFLPLGDTWAWDGDTWTRIDGAGPSPRALAALAYDPKRDVIVLFGGFLDASTRSDETWTLAASTWTKQTPANVPPARSGHALVWGIRAPSACCCTAVPAAARAATRGCGVAATGCSTRRRDRHRRTSRLQPRCASGTQWTPAAPTTKPSPRSFAAAAYDPIRVRVVLFGGTHSGMTLGDTWEWDGTSWERRNVAGPPARSAAGMAWDAARKRIVLFGGVTTQALGDEWEWDGTTWTPVPVVAPARARGNHVLLSALGDGGVLAFGGTNSGAMSLDEMLWLRWDSGSSDDVCDASDRDGDALAAAPTPIAGACARPTARRGRRARACGAAATARAIRSPSRARRARRTARAR